MVWVKVAESCCPFKNRASSACFKGKLSRAMRVVSMTSVLASLQLVRRAVSVLQGLYLYIYIIYPYGCIYILYPYLALHYIAFTFRCITWHCITFTLHIFCGLQICPHTCSKTPSKMILRDLIQKPNLQPTYIPCMTVQLPMTEGRIVAITWICLERFCWSLGVSYPLFLQMEMDGNGRCIHGRTFFHGFNLGRCLDLLRQLLLKCLAASRDMLFWSFLLLTFVQCVAGMSPGGFCTGNFGS